MSTTRPIFLPSTRTAITLGITAAITLTLGSGIARADVVGRLKFTVISAKDQKPVSGAKITLEDSANVSPNIILTTDAKGEAVSPPLENRSWVATTDAESLQVDTRRVTVQADITTEVTIRLGAITQGTGKVVLTRPLIRTGQTASSTVRSSDFYQKYPIGAGNPQSLTSVLRANPGFVQDSVNQVHPRAEHSQTSIYINGFLLPGALQGRAGQFLSPETVQTFDVQTGGFAPEYGGELAAVLNLNLRSGPIKPITDFQIGGGGFSTFQGSLTFGGQAGAPLSGGKETSGDVAKRFGYLVNLSQRNTNNALESPQPNNQTRHNAQQSTTAFGNFGYKLNETDGLTLTLNTAPARTEVANRTGLPDRFANIGQGFGYGGRQNAGSTTTDAAGNTIPLGSQQQDNQDVYQKDNNTFGALQYRKQFSPSVTGVFSFGATQSKLDILNNSPSIDLANLPSDSSLEFNPTIKRKADQTQVQANITSLKGAHTLKYGALYQNQRGTESYRLIPGSQTALNALFAVDPNQVLVPAGGTVGVAEDGSPTYTLPSGTTATSPTLKVKRTGYYAAGYVQDTFKATPRFTINYGLRLDSYRQSQNVAGQENIQKTDLSPRINAAYRIAPLTVARLSYNRLFTQPPLAQGAVIGESIKPQIVNMVEADLERQFGAYQALKLAYYQKYFKNVTDTGILIDGTQIGAYTTHNLEKAIAKGFELSYDLQPRGGVGPGAYFAWANVTDKPSGKDSSTGELLPIGGYTDHDALNTISTGVSYTLANGATFGTSLYYTTGVESSRLFASDGRPLGRQARTEVNLRLSSGPKVIKSGIGVDLAVENLFDSREIINFQSAYSGTRFQQGRRVLLSLSGKF